MLKIVGCKKCGSNDPTISAIMRLINAFSTNHPHKQVNDDSTSPKIAKMAAKQPNFSLGQRDFAARHLDFYAAL